MANLLINFSAAVIFKEQDIVIVISIAHFHAGASYWHARYGQAEGACGFFF